VSTGPVDRSALRNMAGELSDSSLDAAVPVGSPVCYDCARNAIIARIVREVKWCERNGKRWGKKRAAPAKVP
jgi:hypothetical protein